MSDALTTPDELPEPPDDFGAALIAEFEKRGTVIPDDADAPPGGWPGGATADASDIVFDIEAAAKKANTEAVTEADDNKVIETDDATSGESVTPADASEDAPPESTPVVEPKSTDAEPTVPSTGTDGTDPATETPESQQAPVAGYTWEDGEQKHTFTDDEVRRGLMLNNWASSLPEEVRQSFAAIEQGQAVAISREDHEKFVAFQAQQQKQARDADLSNLEAIDPDVAQVIAGLRDEVAQLKGQAPEQPQQFDNLRGNLDQTATQIDQATRLYASAANIPVEQAEQLLGAATNSGVFRHFAEAQAQRHPMSGQVIAPPNWNTVVQAALDYARTQMPNQQITQQPAANPAANPAASTTQNIDPNPPPDPGITAKKARAASVASAPSGAVPQAPRNNQNMTQADRIKAMADEIAAATANT